MFDLDILSDTILPQVDVYTDGGCDPNPGPGGWGGLIRWVDREWVLNGNDPDTTNNRMELHAAAATLALLEGLLGRCQVTLYTDSQYLCQGITEWIEGWISRGWRTRSKKPVKNQDLWRVLHRLTQAHDVTWQWLKGHVGHPLNERADRLATEARSALQTLAVLDEPDDEPDESNEKDSRPNVDIYVKASCRGSQGRGGWGAVLRMGERIKSISGGETSTTSNVMLIRGATEALNALTRPCRVTVYSDANYLINGASRWVKGWQSGGWETRTGKPVANRAEWEALVKAMRLHRVAWRQVKGDDVPPDMVQAGELASQSSQSDNPSA